MSQFKVGDRAKVKDRPGWPGGYQIANWEGQIVEVKENPPGEDLAVIHKPGGTYGFKTGG